MARKPELAELTTRLAMQALGSEGRYKKIFVVGGIGVVVLGVGIFIAAKTVDTREAAAREETFGSLSVCLLGTGVLQQGETPSTRVATVKLGVVGVPLDKRAKAGESPWPASCATHAYALKEHAGDTPLGAAAEALAKVLKADVSATADVSKEVDALWAEANNTKLKATPPMTAVVGPKPAAVLFTQEQFKTLPKVLSGSFSVANVRESGAHLGKLHFLIDQKDTPDGPVVCTASATESAIKCQKVPEAVSTLSPGLRLIGSTEEGARPFFFAGDRGQLGIFPPDGRHAIAATVAYGASARGDGSNRVRDAEGRRQGHPRGAPAGGRSDDGAVGAARHGVRLAGAGGAGVRLAGAPERGQAERAVPPLRAEAGGPAGVARGRRGRDRRAGARGQG
ncbi:MAG: hypothetical protein QM820_43705 [Minicystis sp.]